MGSSLKVKALKDLLTQEHPNIFLIQENKLTQQDFTVQTQRFRNYSGISKGSDGASGGIGTLWNKNKWEISNHQTCNWWVRTDVRSKSTQEVLFIYNIYAPNHYRDKASCWNSLEADLSSIQSSQIIIGGDMNLIRQVEEKFGGNFHPDPFRDRLETIIQTFNLIDTPLSNGKFTWSNKRTGPQNIKERLDRFLIHERLASNFQAIKSHTVHGTASDHKAVTLSLSKGSNFGPLPFKYNKHWDSHEEFCALVRNQWAKEILGSPHYVWENKLKNLKSAIKQWARELANSERKRRSDLLAEIDSWHSEKEQMQPTMDDIEKEKSMFMELYRQNRLEEEEQRLKSRCLWLKAGDKNTSFFHNNVKLRRARNQIDKIEVDGRVLQDQEEIKKAAYDHFQALLTADPQHYEGADFLSPIENKIKEEHNRALEQEPTEEEIREAIFSMQQDKAPGPDGFTVAFYRYHWDIIKKDFVRMVKNAFRKHKVGDFTKSSHIALIPKEANPKSFDRFCPISLCNVSYKTITKIIANRLKILLPFLISENQGGFVPKRQIIDNIILIQEAIHSSLAKGERGMIIKLDMANAFDRVDHAFLAATMRKFGFSSKVVDIIRGCISDPWTAPLINGRPGNSFKSTRGLRQGCPLSPFLFIIMAETLSIHLEDLRCKREIVGVSIERGLKEINHSLFANDTLLIGGASSLMARRFKKVLDAFLQASGGKLNNRKCKIYTWNVPLKIQQSISLIFDIPLQKNWNSFSYLGLPLAKDHIKAGVWTKHIEKMRGLLQSWGVTWLNLAGRTILIKAVLSGLLIYQYAVMLAPASIHKHMELIMRSFLWQGGKQDSKKFSLVNWGQVTLPYEKGGLSIKIPNFSNQAMGLKLIWKIITSKGSWWVEAVKRKYLNGPSSNILNEPIPDRPCTSIWHLIKKVLPHFRENVSKHPGNGKDTKIWVDRIMNTNPRNLQLELRPLQTWMEARRLHTLFDISSWNHDKWKDWKELHLPQDLEDLWHKLKTTLSGAAPVNREAEDSYIWDSCGGSFSVKEGYKSLQNSLPSPNWNLHSATWKSECIPKVKHFNWTLLKGRILTAENLRKRGIQGPSICCFCKAEEETIQHSFLLCPWVQNCWQQLTSPLEARGRYDQVHSLQKNWKKDYPHHRRGKTNLIRIWKCIPVTLCWNLWLARNNLIFNNIQPRMGTIIAKTMASISETISVNYIATPDQATWTQEEKDWYSKYEWGLGEATNNSAEAYSLLMGTNMLLEKGLRNAIIIGDSSIIISSMITGNKFTKKSLNNTRIRILDNLRDLGDSSFRHVLREHNAEADLLASRAVNLKQGQVRIDDCVTYRAIP
eukprot:PITA_10548